MTSLLERLERLNHMDPNALYWVIVKIAENHPDEVSWYVAEMEEICSW